jgi:hypothetical protein
LVYHNDIAFIRKKNKQEKVVFKKPTKKLYIIYHFAQQKQQKKIKHCQFNLVDNYSLCQVTCKKKWAKKNNKTHIHNGYLALILIYKKETLNYCLGKVVCLKGNKVCHIAQKTSVRTKSLTILRKT